MGFPLPSSDRWGKKTPSAISVSSVESSSWPRISTPLCLMTNSTSSSGEGSARYMCFSLDAHRRGKARGSRSRHHPGRDEHGVPECCVIVGDGHQDRGGKAQVL